MFRFMPFLTLSQSDQKPLSQSSRKVLCETTFSATQPNAIVQDFETFIEFLQLYEVEVSTNQQAIAPKYLADLNSRLSHPVAIDFQRPSQKSYPNIHGLYLLLRGSGFGVVRSDKRRNVLSVESQVLASWQGLNAIEKYFNLLATWIYYSSEGIMSNDHRALPEWYFVVSCWDVIAKENLNFTSNSANNSPNNSKSNEWLNRLKLHNVALLHLFGFIELQDTSPLAGKGWRLTKAKALPFGKALMELLQKTNWKKGLFNEAEDDFIGLFIEPSSEPQSPEPKLNIVEQQPTPTEILQEEFQALDLFLEWEKNLELPEPEIQDGVFVFKVSLQIHIQKSKDKFSKETIWRKIVIPSNLTLYDFSSAILKAFNFYNDHLHQFTYKDRQGFVKTINHPYAEHSDGDSFTDEILLRDWQISTGDRITYVFDFGDWWEFNVVLESIDEPDPKLKEAKVIDQKGEAPKQYDDDECEDYE